MNLKEARKARHEAFTGLEQAQKRLREAEAALEDAKVRAGQQAANDRFLSGLNKAEKKRYHENVAQAGQILNGWSDDEVAEWYICLRKVLHMSWGAAAEASRHDANMHPYLCVYCTAYHAGHGTYREEPPHRERVYAKLIEKVHKLQPYRDK